MPINTRGSQHCQHQTKICPLRQNQHPKHTRLLAESDRKSLHKSPYKKNFIFNWNLGIHPNVMYWRLERYRFIETHGWKGSWEVIESSPLHKQSSRYIGRSFAPEESNFSWMGKKELPWTHEMSINKTSVIFDSARALHNEIKRSVPLLVWQDTAQHQRLITCLTEPSDSTTTSQQYPKRTN